MKTDIEKRKETQKLIDHLVLRVEVPKTQELIIESDKKTFKRYDKISTGKLNEHGNPIHKIISYNNWHARIDIKKIIEDLKNWESIVIDFPYFYNRALYPSRGSIGYYELGDGFDRITRTPKDRWRSEGNHSDYWIYQEGPKLLKSLHANLLYDPTPQEPKNQELIDNNICPTCGKHINFLDAKNNHLKHNGKKIIKSQCHKPYTFENEDGCRNNKVSRLQYRRASEVSEYRRENDEKKLKSDEAYEKYERGMKERGKKPLSKREWLRQRKNERKYKTYRKKEEAERRTPLSFDEWMEKYR